VIGREDGGRWGRPRPAGRVIGREDGGRWGRPRPAGRDWTTTMPIPSGAGGGWRLAVEERGGYSACVRSERPSRFALTRGALLPWRHLLRP